MSPFTATCLVTLLAFAGLWWASLRRRDVSIVDLYWGPGVAVIAAVAFATGGGTDPRRFLVVTLAAMWGFRLGGYLYWRKQQAPGEDFRYADLRARLGGDFALGSLVTVFLPQALVMWVVTWPVQWAVTTPSDPELGVLDAVGFGLWAAGFAMEAMADLQLADFRANPANAGKVLETGLWRWSRHPNYFGDCCVWWGFYAFACATPNGWWTFVGPLLMTILLLRVTGVPLLERSLRARKAGYAAYADRTSPFVPAPPRAAASAVGEDRRTGGTRPE